MTVIELGGGEHPNFRPNLDRRKNPNVDIVADLESPLPLKSEAFDFVYSQFAMEHISWKRVTGYIQEIYRVLKPNGKTTVITSDLRAQMLYLLKKETWGLHELETIFGSQDYPENAHKSSMSMELATKLFRDAGFINVKTTQVGICATDMQIEGEKMSAESFDRSYFDGRGYGSGKGDFYRDFPQHHKTAEEILKRKPENVLEIGGARGYICKILQANGVPATCMDISLHCWHTRAIKEFSLWDATETPWGMHRQEWLTQISGQITGIPDKYSFQEWITSPIMPKEFDLCFSIAFLEHIPEDKLPNMILEMTRVTKRGLHGITFKIDPADKDTTHVTIHPKEWWQTLFANIAPNYPVEIVDKEDLEKEPITLPKSDGLVKLNIGCFADMFYYGWTNIDQIDLREWAKFRGYNFTPMDVKNGINRPDNSVDIILASHFLEHLNRDEGAKFLQECWRVLKPDGLLRLAVPDAKLLAKSYLDGTIMEYRHVNISVDRALDSAEAFYDLLLSGHQTIYDEESLTNALGGKSESRDNEKLEITLTSMWRDIKFLPPFESSSKAVELQTISMYPTLTLYLEAKKPNSWLNRDKRSQNMLSVSSPLEEASTHVEPTSKAPETAENTAYYKIALLSTPLLTVPPINYGGLEMIVADLGRELAKLGHDVTIYAPNGSKVEGCTIVETNPPANNVFMDWLRAEQEMFDKIKDQLNTFDIIHGHNWFGMEYRAKALNPKLHVLHTHHGGLVADWWSKTRAPFKLNMCAISDWMKSLYERQGIPTRAVHNGVDPEKYPLQRKKSDRFLFLGRIAFFKAPHQAIKIAQETGIKLDVVGATQFVEDAKYVEEIKKSCDGEQIRFIGEVTHEKKLEYLQNAKALIVPALWGEPFGLHVVESMMVGTQVLAVADGGIKETVKQGGVLCQDTYALADAVKNFRKILPTTCRKNALLFSTENMARGYERAYRDILAGKEW